MSVITISRQFGAGGITLGNMVAQRLGYSFVDNEIIQRMAERAKVSENWVASIEKEVGGKLQKFVSGLLSKSFFDRLLDNDKGYIDEEIYMDLLEQIVRQLAAEDNVIILGRGSQYILRQQPDTFHVLLIASREDRVAFMEKKYALSTAQAFKSVAAMERRRANLYRKFGKENFDDPGLYHLVINRSRVSLHKACDLVCKVVAA